MSLLIIILVTLAFIVGLLLIRKYTSVEFVAHARLLWRTWSVWLGSIGAVIGAALLQFPDAALNAWNMLPPDLKSYVPPHILSYISPTLMGLAVAAQYIRQPKLKERAEQMRGDQ
jgi:hypothetical protein